MAATCLHGLPPDECLICPHSVTAEVVSRSPAPPVRRGHGATHLAVVAVAIVVIGAVAWAVAGVLFALLHVFELVAVALVAGWGGYRIGHFRGRRQRS
jgi:hypothetical protein